MLAANLDAAAVVEPVHPEPDLGRIERLLALAYESGARPLVVLTKADLRGRPGRGGRASWPRSRPGCRCCRSAPNAAPGWTPLRAEVAPGRTLGLLGPSGAGKSSLVNALVGATVMPTQAIRRVDGKGRHTTTYRALVPIPGGGAVLDTPGVRAVGLLDARGRARPGVRRHRRAGRAAAGSPTAATTASRAARSGRRWRPASSATAPVGELAQAAA